MRSFALAPLLCRLLAILAAAMSFAAPAGATTVLQLSLDQIIDQSTTVFEGTCIDNRTERDAATGFVVTYTTFEVRDVLKGEAQATHVIKQVGGQAPGDDAPGFRIPGVPRFVPGEDYVVFLAGVSSAGFSSPIGLSQGRFNVRRQAGRASAGNGRDFRELIAYMPDQVPPQARERIQAAPGPVRELDLDEFKQIVRQRASSRP